MRVRWTEPAVVDLTRICDYIAEHGRPGAARRVAQKILESVGTLSQFPERGRPGRKAGTRELLFEGLPYLAVYRIRGDAPEVIRVLHGAQKWP
jgi:plasmid stabilization system protein ParE